MVDSGDIFTAKALWRKDCCNKSIVAQLSQAFVASLVGPERSVGCAKLAACGRPIQKEDQRIASITFDIRVRTSAARQHRCAFTPGFDQRRLSVIQKL